MRRIKHYEFMGIPINRDYNILGKQVYIGYGQGCHTFWFNSVEEAKAFIKKLKDKIKVDERGLGLIPIELCLNCKCHYSYGTKEWKKAKREFNCREFKEQLIAETLQSL